MQKEIFDLLVDISNKGYIDIERQGNFINRDIVIEENKIRNSLNYLLSQGLISNSSNNIFIITEFGYEVSRYSSWIDYITKQKEIRDRKTRKENIDLKNIRIPSSDKVSSLLHIRHKYINIISCIDRPI